MQQQTASVSAQTATATATATAVKNYNYYRPGGNTCLYKGGFLIITFGANYNIDIQLHYSHYSNIIMAPTIRKKKKKNNQWPSFKSQDFGGTLITCPININININLNVNMTSHSPLLNLSFKYIIILYLILICLILIIWMLFLTFYFPTCFSFTVKHFVAPCNVNQVIITLIILDRFLFKPWSVHPCLILSVFFPFAVWSYLPIPCTHHTLHNFV